MRVVRFGLPTKKLKLGTIELDAYVLDDYIRVVEKNKLEKALGKEGKSEQWLLDFNRIHAGKYLYTSTIPTNHELFFVTCLIHRRFSNISC